MEEGNRETLHVRTHRSSQKEFSDSRSGNFTVVVLPTPDRGSETPSGLGLKVVTVDRVCRPGRCYCVCRETLKSEGTKDSGPYGKGLRMQEGNLTGQGDVSRLTSSRRGDSHQLLIPDKSIEIDSRSNQIETVWMNGTSKGGARTSLSETLLVPGVVSHPLV